MKNYTKGIELTDEIRQAMKKYREMNGNIELRSACNQTTLNHMTWKRVENGDHASWESWSEIYKLLLSAGLIDGMDVDIMPIERMKDLLKKYIAESKSQSALVGNNNTISQSAVGDHAVNNVAADDIIDKVMSSDMCDSCKIKAYNIIKGKWDQ